MLDIIFFLSLYHERHPLIYGQVVLPHSTFNYFRAFVWSIRQASSSFVQAPKTCFKHTKCPFNSISGTAVRRLVPLFLSTPRVADRSHQPLLKGITRITYQPTSVLKAFNQIWQEAVLQNIRIMGCSWKFADGICEPSICVNNRLHVYRMETRSADIQVFVICSYALYGYLSPIDGTNHIWEPNNLVEKRFDTWNVFPPCRELDVLQSFADSIDHSMNSQTSRWFGDPMNVGCFW